MSETTPDEFLPVSPPTPPAVPTPGFVAPERETIVGPTVLDNRPRLAEVLDRLRSLPATLLAHGDPTGDQSFRTVQRMLDEAVAWVEDKATTAFNSTAFYDQHNFELYDGNTTNQIMVRKRPILSVQLLEVVTPILGYTRVYLPDEIKTYVKQGVIKVWTYKLAVEQALLQTLDYQAWGNLFPPLPQAIQLAYTYGYPLFDPTSPKVTPTGPATSFDGGVTWQKGDLREPEMLNWLTNLQEAAVCQAAAQFLGTVVGLSRGIVGSVSFDGYSRSLVQNPYAAEVQMLMARRDELLGRRSRRFIMSTVGG